MPRLLRPGDSVRLVSPASTPEEAGVARTVRRLEELGLRPSLGRHVFDRLGYLAGRDEDRLADLNDAFRDPAVRAVIATRGGKGAYRIAGGLDFSAIRADPKLLVGFSEITILHLAVWHHARVPGLHGACWDEGLPAESFAQSVLTAAPVIVAAQPEEPTAALTTSGRASGILLGGNLDMIAAAAGWTLPSLSGAILLIEDVGKGLGHIDRHLTRLFNAGCLRGVVGVAVGQFTDCDTAEGWTVIDVLQDHLPRFGVPVLGGLPLGHGTGAVAVPVGTAAVLDADRGMLTVEAASS